MKMVFFRTLKVETPWDVEGADVLLIYNAGEILAWPENPGAFAVILNAAGIKWTLSSELAGYDSINYGVWYDDAQFARVALKHAEAARKLKVKKIVLGECGHAHKALSVIADRILTGDRCLSAGDIHRGGGTCRVSRASVPDQVRTWQSARTMS